MGYCQLVRYPRSGTCAIPQITTTQRRRLPFIHNTVTTNYLSTDCDGKYQAAGIEYNMGHCTTAEI